MDADHHQKLITSRGSPLAHACQVWSTSVSAFVSYRIYRMMERKKNHITSASSAEVMSRDVRPRGLALASRPIFSGLGLKQMASALSGTRPRPRPNGLKNFFKIHRFIHHQHYIRPRALLAVEKLIHQRRSRERHCLVTTTAQHQQKHHQQWPMQRVLHQ